MKQLEHIIYYGADRETYEMCLPHIIRHNSHDVCYLSQVFLGTMIVFSLLSLMGLNPQFARLYIVNAALFALIALISHKETIARRYSSLLVFSFSCGIIIFGIIASLADHTMVATAFHVLMVVIAIFFITTIPPMAVILSLGVIGLAISSFMSKPYSLAVGDLYNGVIFLVVALILHYNVQRDRLRSYVNDYILHETQHQLAIESHFDGLSGLFNRRYFFEVANNITLTDDHTICLLDIDQFKKVNDAYGHHTGDVVIKTLGKIIRQTLGLPEIENGSAVSISTNMRHTFAGRLGGDEFIMLIGSDGPDPFEAGREIQRAMSRISFNNLKGVGISMGYASVRDYPDVNLDVLYRIADIKMYQTKALHHQSTLPVKEQSSQITQHTHDSDILDNVEIMDITDATLNIR